MKEDGLVLSLASVWVLENYCCVPGEMITTDSQSGHTLRNNLEAFT